MSSSRISAETQQQAGGNRSNHRQHNAAVTIGPAINHMLQHLEEPLWVSNLSSMIGISSSHFYVLFKHATGYSPIKFLIRLRIQRACELLTNRNLNIKQIAAEVGYDDEFYFSRMFKSVTGMAPSDYRQRIIGFAEIPLPRPGLHCRPGWATRVAGA